MPRCWMRHLSVTVTCCSRSLFPSSPRKTCKPVVIEATWEESLNITVVEGLQNCLSTGGREANTKDLYSFCSPEVPHGADNKGDHCIKACSCDSRHLYCILQPFWTVKALVEASCWSTSSMAGQEPEGPSQALCTALCLQCDLPLITWSPFCCVSLASAVSLQCYAWMTDLFLEL